MADERTYSVDQVAVAARELRQAAGANEQRLTAAEVVAMLRDEMRLLHERGFTDAQIAELLDGFDIPVTAEQIAADAGAPIHEERA